IIFRSASSSLNVLQRHQGSTGDTQESSSEDEPHRLLHTVTKPIIQEIHEVISPYRKIVQEVHPVQEEIKTVVAKNSNNLNNHNNQQYQTVVAQRQPLMLNQQYAAAASSTKNHLKSSPIVLNSMDSLEEDDDGNNDYQKLIQSGSTLTSSILKGNDIDGKSIAKTMDQSLSKSIGAILKT
ncbi:hypothetical protein BLA29_012443, partial [Euroglyphus maynei]